MSSGPATEERRPRIKVSRACRSGEEEPRLSLRDVAIKQLIDNVTVLEEATMDGEVVPVQLTGSDVHAVSEQVRTYQ